MMGYPSTRPPTYPATLYTLARIFDVSAQYLSAPRHRSELVVEYGKRLWTDRHLEALGWALVGTAITLVFLVAWFVQPR